jgi:hypothetical protein
MRRRYFVLIPAVCANPDDFLTAVLYKFQNFQCSVIIGPIIDYDDGSWPAGLGTNARDGFHQFLSSVIRGHDYGHVGVVAHGRIQDVSGREHWAVETEQSPLQRVRPTSLQAG